MIDFRDEDQKTVFTYFAKSLGNDFALSVGQQKKEVTNSTEATNLTNFYWQMVDKAALADKNNQVIDGVLGMQPIMEDLINIIGGYLERCGFGDEWDADDEN